MVILYALLLAVLSMVAGIQPGQGSSNAAASSPEDRPAPTITVVYDDHSQRADLRADHGFSCLVEGYDQTVLFDTGASGDILLANMHTLGIASEGIDAVVLSHAHQDHTGGLTRILALNPDVTVYYPASFSEAFVREVREAGATTVPVDVPTALCPGLTITGPLGTSVREIGLVVGTSSGALLITGCAHPGIVTMARTTAELSGGSMTAVMGGFHLGGASTAQVQAIIRDLVQLGVQRCGPAHCTGDAATALMRRAFGPGFVEMAAGATIEL